MDVWDGRKSLIYMDIWDGGKSLTYGYGMGGRGEQDMGWEGEFIIWILGGRKSWVGYGMWGTV